MSIPNINLFSKTVVTSHQSDQSIVNLDCEKIDRENKTLQEVKGKSFEDEAKNNDGQKLNTKTETDAVKVKWSNI